MIADSIASFFRSSTSPQFRNATLENPSYSLNDPAAYESLAGGSKSAAGPVVTHSNSLSLAAVWQALSLISGDVAKLPLYPYVRTNDDDREIDDSHQFYIPTSVRANAQTSAFQFWRTQMIHALLWGNGYAFIDRTPGQTEFYVLLPDRTTAEWITVSDRTVPGGERSQLIYITEVNGKVETVLPQNMFHIRGISLDGKLGCDLVRAARDAWGLALAAQNFESKFFKNGARKGGILELPLGITKMARDTIEEGFRKTYEEGDNPFRTVILREGSKFHDGQVTPEQGQVIDLREEQKREVASFFNLPPSKLGIRDSVSYNSFEQDNLSYLWGCLHHWLVTITSECAMKLLSEKQLLTDTHYFEHNVSKFQQADWKTLNEGLEIMRRNEIISANEWRRKLNLNRRKDDGGDEYVNPNIRTNSSSSGDNGRSQKAHRDLFVDTLNRMARRVSHDARAAAKTPAKFVAWIDSGASEHRTIFAEALRPVATAYVSVFGGGIDNICTTAQASFFDGMLTSLAAFVEPPHSASDLAVNVGRSLDVFERTAGERVTTFLLENVK